MLKFGTLKQVDNEEINITIGTLEITYYKDGKKQDPITNPELEIEIKFNIDNDNYYYNFYITKPFQDYLKLNNYEKIKLEDKYIKDDYSKINDEVISLPKFDIEVQRINNNLIFVINSKSFLDEYFFTTEFEYSLTNIEKSL